MISVYGEFFTICVYLYDSGADITIITEKIFKKIQTEDENTKIETYQIQNVKVIVTGNHCSNYTCIVGTDLMKKIPEFNDSLQKIEEMVNKMSKQVVARYERAKTKNQGGYMKREKKNGDTTFHLETVSGQMEEQKVEQHEHRGQTGEQHEEERKEKETEKTEKKQLVDKRIYEAWFYYHLLKFRKERYGELLSFRAPYVEDLDNVIEEHHELFLKFFTKKWSSHQYNHPKSLLL